MAVAVLLLLLLLPGCQFIVWPRKEIATEIGAVGASEARQVYLGSVSYVDEAKGFVLFKSNVLEGFDTGEELEVRSVDEAVRGLLRVTPERRRQFLAADIVSGRAEVGDRVYRFVEVLDRGDPAEKKSIWIWKWFR
ncbi:MAG: hypothetical protein ACC661_09910 [Verrucomicrobiales bacterium]